MLVLEKKNTETNKIIIINNKTHKEKQKGEAVY